MIICQKCKKPIKKVGYSVKTIDTEGEIMFPIACSEQCASSIKDANVKLHERRMKEVESCSIQKCDARGWFIKEVTR